MKMRCRKRRTELANDLQILLHPESGLPGKRTSAPASVMSAKAHKLTPQEGQISAQSGIRSCKLLGQRPQDAIAVFSGLIVRMAR
jgi:hypothetical protein